VRKLLLATTLASATIIGHALAESTASAETSSVEMLIPANAYKTLIFINITVKILPTDGDRFTALLRTAAAEAPKASVFVKLNSPGGNVGAAVTMASVITHIHATVTVNGTCASSCFLLFAAGENKGIAPGSQIGVHSVSNEKGVEDADTAAVTLALARIYSEIGVPTDITGRMVTTAPNDIAWLTVTELAKMHVTWFKEPLNKSPSTRSRIDL
jgi:hypothetical protein